MTCQPPPPSGDPAVELAAALAAGNEGDRPGPQAWETPARPVLWLSPGRRRQLEAAGHTVAEATAKAAEMGFELRLQVPSC